MGDKQTFSGNSDHFHMSDEYERDSSSQQTIGHTVIDSVASYARSNLKGAKKIKVLDIACGPGNLTLELKQALERTIPETKIDVTGLDYTAENITLLIKNSKKGMQGIIGSFYELPIHSGTEDIITSNEGLHWQPPYPDKMNDIIYSHLSGEDRAKHKAWALTNFMASIKGIYESLRQGGIAVLQFGHEGQLQKLWDLISEVLDDPKFNKYKSKVNFPLFYPEENDIRATLLKAGFTDENIEIQAFSQDLSENTPESIVKFFMAFTKPQFSTFFSPDDLKDFYAVLEKKLSKMNIDNFRKDQWHRTLVKVKK